MNCSKSNLKPKFSFLTVSFLFYSLSLPHIFFIWTLVGFRGFLEVVPKNTSKSRNHYQKMGSPSSKQCQNSCFCCFPKLQARLSTIVALSKWQELLHFDVFESERYDHIPYSSNLPAKSFILPLNVFNVFFCFFVNGRRNRSISFRLFWFLHHYKLCSLLSHTVP